MNKFLLAGFVFMICSCTSLPGPNKKVYYYADFLISLSSVEKPESANDRYSDRIINVADLDERYKYSYEDEIGRFKWLVTGDSIDFFLENNTSNSIRIIWDEASYVDVYGKSYRMMHSNQSYSQKGTSQPPMIIVRKGNGEASVYPEDFVLMSKYFGLYKKSLLSNFASNKDYESLDKFSEERKSYLGKKIQVLLPLQVNDSVSDYIFEFIVENVEFIEITEEEIMKNFGSSLHSRLTAYLSEMYKNM